MNIDEAIITTSAEETEKLGFEFGKQLHGGNIVCLYGDLGSGKTTFVKGLAKGLGIESRIISPTFVLLRTHVLSTTNDQQPVTTLYHLDLYRLEKDSEIEGIGLNELFEDKNGVVLIEWAEKAKNVLPKKKMNIQFEYIESNKRRITIKKE